MGKKGDKRKKSDTSPTNSAGQPKTKMAQVTQVGAQIGTQGGGTPNLQQQPCTPQYTQNAAGNPYIMPPTFQIPSPQMQNQPQYMGTFMNTGSPLCTQQIGGQNIQIDKANATVRNSDELLLTIISRLDNVDKKLGQLDKISGQINDMNGRLNTMDKKIFEIEESQKFICKTFDDVSKSTSQNQQDIKTLQAQVDTLSQNNAKLKTDKDSMLEDIIDLKCRSMRDNLLFFGISEGATSVNTSDSVSMETNSTAGGGGVILQEDCDAKIYHFCENVLKISNASSEIQIDRSHRMGAKVPGKTRPIVVKFKDTKSKMTVKNSLKGANLKSTTYNVTDQYPTEVQDRRRSLIPVMIQARKDNKKAVLVRDKLYINNRLYIPRDNATE